MRNEKCGVYLIECRVNGRRYIGSSYQIYVRWTQHRTSLRRGKSNCRYLQSAWTKHGEDAFRFSILEECGRDDLEGREQHYIDMLKPAYNSIIDVRRRYSVEARAKIAASVRARAAKITHCPRGHAYDETNTYRNKKGKRICRACNALRVSAVYANETAEQRERRRKRAAEDFQKNREARQAQMFRYRLAHKAEKREYDRRYRTA